jgi:hypothetical protein
VGRGGHRPPGARGRRGGPAPNLVAVDFREIGDLMRAVDRINGVGAKGKE